MDRLLYSVFRARLEKTWSDLPKIYLKIWLERVMTYARARLWLGISGVGFWVIVSTAILTLVRPPSLLGGGDLADCARLVGLYIALSLPFDILGGFQLPRRFGRPVGDLAGFIFSWFRGAVIHGLLMIGTGLGLIAAARTWGMVGVVAVAGLVMVLLVGLQGWVARLIGGLKGSTVNLDPALEIMKRWGLAAPRLAVVRVTDPAFSGGWTGLPGAERLVIPANWVEKGVAGTGEARLPHLTVEELAAQLTRRVGVLRTGSRWRGLAIALGWNLTGVILAGLVSGLAIAQPSGTGETVMASLLLLRFAAVFTIWSFAGLLLLPSVSRPGVYAADRFALAQGVPAELITTVARTIDRGQDDEPGRPGGIETIFHPLPSLNNRLARMEAEGGGPGGWQAARLALFTSWGALGLLGRAVHCNSGRPELWVLLPAD